jgi:hypothetical protein
VVCSLRQMPCPGNEGFIPWCGVSLEDFDAVIAELLVARMQSERVGLCPEDLTVRILSHKPFEPDTVILAVRPYVCLPQVLDTIPSRRRHPQRHRRPGRENGQGHCDHGENHRTSTWIHVGSFPTLGPRSQLRASALRSGGIRQATFGGNTLSAGLDATPQRQTCPGAPDFLGGLPDTSTTADCQLGRSAVPTNSCCRTARIRTV